MTLTTILLLLAAIQIACGAWCFLRPREAMAFVAKNSPQTRREREQQEKLWIQFRILGAILIFCGSYLGMMVLGDPSLPSPAR